MGKSFNKAGNKFKDKIEEKIHKNSGSIIEVLTKNIT